MKTTKWSESAASQWSKNAANWHANSVAMWEEGSRKTVLPLFSRYVQPNDGTVLDAGCADGYASWKMAVNGYKVEAVDISSEMVQLAKKRTHETLTAHFQTGDVTQLTFSDQTFAGIICINVVEFTESPLTALLEFHRLLQPKGILVLGILGPTAGPRAYSYRRLYGEQTIQNTMMPWEAKQLAEENGFNLIEQEPVYREGITPDIAASLTAELRQAVSFLTLFVLQKQH